MKNIYKSLEAIERIVGSDLGMEAEWWLNDPKKNHRDKLKVNMAKALGKIYMIVHSENSRGCRHTDWEEIKYQILKITDND
jgi:hypothetical protein